MADERRMEIVDELKELGRQLQALIRTAAQSDTTKELEQEISKGIHEVSHQVDTALKQVRDTRAAKDLGTQVQKVVESPQVAEVAQEIRTGLVRGLQELNAQLRKVAARAEEETEGSGEPPPEEPGI